jgi:hypothetical protein
MTGWINYAYGGERERKRMEKRHEKAAESVRGTAEKFDRVKYQREYMRKRRAKVKEVR